MKPTALVFDFDGVLADTYEAYVNFLAKTFRQKEAWARKRVLQDSLEHLPKNLVYQLLSRVYFHRFGHYLAKQTGLIFEDRLAEIAKIELPKAVLTRTTRKICHNMLGEEVDMFVEINGRNQSKNKIHGLEQICRHPEFDKQSLLFFTDTIADILQMQTVLRQDQIYAVAWGRFNRLELLQKHLPREQILHSSFQECPLWQTNLNNF
jgi:phosphoglycolate phosphatase-like HAD superfamily hydrolase